ncbi:hypothetical protein RFI_01969 [Reticulomyxa filosa]|uniref:Cyclic nucleotide-binding domain-containing protein n=1 Tax=Reticulomyxa filosa TaxID=46433 RepID=X6PAB0_RETFI|nr:hypothetical protein RFI_01969 [Reticulomyxa filosa]|eukprot:ETO35106.1 hypothetical protein RFI_01969 [Reticulomyxa filosa]
MDNKLEKTQRCNVKKRDSASNHNLNENETESDNDNDNNKNAQPKKNSYMQMMALSYNETSDENDKVKILSCMLEKILPERLSWESRYQMALLFKKCYYSKGMEIINPSNKDNGLHIIIQGTVLMSMYEGDNSVVLGPGDHFGEDKYKTARAISSVTVLHSVICEQDNYKSGDSHINDKNCGIINKNNCISGRHDNIIDISDDHSDTDKGGDNILKLGDSPTQVCEDDNDSYGNKSDSIVVDGVSLLQQNTEEEKIKTEKKILAHKETGSDSDNENVSEELVKKRNDYISMSQNYNKIADQDNHNKKIMMTNKKGSYREFYLYADKLNNKTLCDIAANCTRLRAQGYFGNIDDSNNPIYKYEGDARDFFAVTSTLDYSHQFLNSSDNKKNNFAAYPFPCRNLTEANCSRGACIKCRIFFYIYHKCEKIWILPCGHYLCRSCCHSYFNQIYNLHYQWTESIQLSHNNLMEKWKQKGIIENIKHGDYFKKIIEAICTEKIFNKYEENNLCRTYILCPCSRLECKELRQYFSGENANHSENNKYPKCAPTFSDKTANILLRYRKYYLKWKGCDDHHDSNVITKNNDERDCKERRKRNSNRNNQTTIINTRKNQNHHNEDINKSSEKNISSRYCGQMKQEGIQTNNTDLILHAGKRRLSDNDCTPNKRKKNISNDLNKHEGNSEEILKQLEEMVQMEKMKLTEILDHIIIINQNIQKLAEKQSDMDQKIEQFQRQQNACIFQPTVQQNISKNYINSTSSNTNR